MMYTTIYGIPGSGKTRTLVSLVEDCSKTIKKKSIALMSFANAPVYELIDRIKGRPEIRTLHSFCLKRLIEEGIVKKSEVKDIEEFRKKFCEERGIEYDKGDFFSESEGNRIFSHWTRIIGKYYPRVRDIDKCLDIMYKEDEYHASVIEEYLKEKNIVDYEDMIILSFENDIHHDKKILFFDEAQDFNLLEFQVALKLSKDTYHTYFAGDPLQSILDFKSADPKLFRSLDAERILLSTSNRVPKNILFGAFKLVKNLKENVYETINSKVEKGKVYSIDLDNFEQLAELVKQVTLRWNKKTFVLLRTNRLVRKLCRILDRQLFPYNHLKTESKWTKSRIHFYNAIFKIKHKELGLKLKKEEVIALSKWLKYYKSKGVIRIDKFSREEVERAIRTLEVLRKIPTIRKPVNVDVRDRLFIDTIHSAKGREADIVILVDVITSTVQEIIRTDPASERRVWFTGMTRTKNTLIIATIKGQKKYLSKLLWMK